MKRDQPRKNSFSNRRRAFIMLGLRYGIIFSERVGINERIKMHIPASTFACLWISDGEKERARGRKRDRKIARKKDGKGREGERESRWEGG